MGAPPAAWGGDAAVPMAPMGSPVGGGGCGGTAGDKVTPGDIKPPQAPPIPPPAPPSPPPRPQTHSGQWVMTSVGRGGRGDSGGGPGGSMAQERLWLWGDMGGTWGHSAP